MSDAVDDDPQFFADGARWDIAVVIAVCAAFAGAVFGWTGVAAVLAVPVGLVLVFGVGLTIVVVTLVAAVWDVQRELEEINDE